MLLFGVAHLILAVFLSSDPMTLREQLGLVCYCFAFSVITFIATCCIFGFVKTSAVAGIIRSDEVEST